MYSKIFDCNGMLRYDCGSAGKIFSPSLARTDSIFDDSANDNKPEDNDNNGYNYDNNNGLGHQT
jgi:hypothetical protein